MTTRSPNARAFETSVIIVLPEGTETELKLRVDYSFTPGQGYSFEEPAHGASASIDRLTLASLEGEALAIPDWLDVVIKEDEALLDSLIVAADEADYQSAQDAADDALDEARLSED